MQMAATQLAMSRVSGGAGSAGRVSTVQDVFSLGIRMNMESWSCFPRGEGCAQ